MVLLQYKKITTSHSCPLCNANLETHEHTLDCSKIAQIWATLTVPPNFFSKNLHSWLFKNTTNNHTTKYNVPCVSTLFAQSDWLETTKSIKTNLSVRLSSQNLSSAELRNFGQNSPLPLPSPL